MNGDRKGQLFISVMLLLNGVWKWEESLLEEFRRCNIGMVGRCIMGKHIERCGQGRYGCPSSSSREMGLVVRGENWWYGRRRRSVCRGYRICIGHSRKWYSRDCVWLKCVVYRDSRVFWFWFGRGVSCRDEDVRRYTITWRDKVLGRWICYVTLQHPFGGR